MKKGSAEMWFRKKRHTIGTAGGISIHQPLGKSFRIVPGHGTYFGEKSTHMTGQIF